MLGLCPVLPVASKEHVVSELKRAHSLLGRVPGLKAFESETGIHRTQFIGVHWPRWSDAVADAGLEPNALTQALPLNDLLFTLADLALELKKLPTSLDLRFAAKNRSGFPASNTFESRLGSVTQRSKLLSELARENPKYQALLDFLPTYENSTAETLSTEKITDNLGIVYLSRKSVSTRSAEQILSEGENMNWESNCRRR